MNKCVSYTANVKLPKLKKMNWLQKLIYNLTNK